jgi:C-terminal processing protease CtpA/Prc
MMRSFCLSLALLSVVVGCTSSQPVQKKLSDDQCDRLVAFTKLYGYVKYFHPSDEAAKINWDDLAVYGVERVLATRNSQELKTTLTDMFMPLGPSLLISSVGENAVFSRETIIPHNTDGLKIVVWQHIGVGLSAQSVYRSARTNRAMAILSGEVGNMLRSIDITKYRGKDFRYVADVKVEPSEGNGRAQLWFRVDKEGGGAGFFDNMTDRPIRDRQWNEYTIQGKIDDDAKSAFFGCLFFGSGRFWVDDFRLFVKTNDQWNQIPIGDSDFEIDTVGATPAGWSFTPGSSARVTSETSKNGTNSLLVAKVSKSQQITQLFREMPKVGETVNTDLGAGLSCVVPLALYSNAEGTIPKGESSRFDQLAAEITSHIPRMMTAENRNVRLADIMIAWNVMQHFYPYFDVVKTNWQQALREALVSAHENETAAAFQKTLRKMVAQLHDGHGRVWRGQESGQRYCLPIQWEWIEGQLVITSVYDSTLTNVRVGDLVTHINGKPAQAAVEEEEQYTSGATPQWTRYQAVSNLISGERNEEVKLTIASVNEKTTTVSVRRSMALMPYSQLSKIQFGGKWKRLSDRLYYLNISLISMAEIDSLMPDLQKAKGVICDLRGYPNGNHELIEHLMKNSDTSSSWMRIPKIIYPDHEKNVAFVNSGWHLEPKAPNLQAKVAFLTDGRAISYAESFMSFIENYRLAAIVGGPTAGTNGNVNPLTLPGGYTVTWTGMKVVKHDGSTHHGVGIKPTVPVSRTIAGVRAGKDEVLEKAIQIVSQ